MTSAAPGDMWQQFVCCRANTRYACVYMYFISLLPGMVQPHVKCWSPLDVCWC